MSLGDKATRPTAIPFEALPFSETAYTFRLSDTTGGNPLTSNIVAIPFTTPEKGEIVEMYLMLSLNAANASGFSLRTFIGDFSDMNNLTPRTSYSEKEIAAGHLKLNHTSSKFVVSAGARLDLLDIQLLKAIPKKGDATYVSDGFVLVLAFDSIPSQGNGWWLNVLKVLGSAQMGLAT